MNMEKANENSFVNYFKLETVNFSYRVENAINVPHGRQPAMGKICHVSIANGLKVDFYLFSKLDFSKLN